MVNACLCPIAPSKVVDTKCCYSCSTFIYQSMVTTKVYIQELNFEIFCYHFTNHVQHKHSFVLTKTKNTIKGKMQFLYINPWSQHSHDTHKPGLTCQKSRSSFLIYLMPVPWYRCVPQHHVGVQSKVWLRIVQTEGVMSQGVTEHWSPASSRYVTSGHTGVGSVR